jgi:hypothetical protein
LASVMADLRYVAAIHCVSKVLFLHKLCSFRKQQWVSCVGACLQITPVAEAL